MASPRRQGREVALQILCAVDGNADLDAAASLNFYAAQVAGSEDEEAGLPDPSAYDRAFTESLVSRATEKHEEIDRTITQVSRTWRLDRMAKVDRNILRLAVAELLFFPEIPARVTINEAVELAKRYGAAESPAFVNGLLDSALKALELPK
jgi:transcription antitermination protein NusB